MGHLVPRREQTFNAASVIDLAPCTGIPSQSVMWGPWATGMAATDPRIAARFTKSGLSLIQPHTGIQLLASALGTLIQQSTVLAAPLVWSKLLAAPAPVPQFLEDFAPSRVASVAAAVGQPSAVVADAAAVAAMVGRIVEAMLGAVVGHNQVRIFSYVRTKHVVRESTHLLQYG